MMWIMMEAPDDYRLPVTPTDKLIESPAKISAHEAVDEWIQAAVELAKPIPT